MSDPAEPSQNLRLFVAVELPGEVRRSLEQAIEVLRNAGADRGLRWVRPEGIHVTLKFLGAVPEPRVPEIAAALRDAVRASGIAPFELQPFRLGSFHGGKHMPHEFRGKRKAYHYNLRVLWVGMRGDTEALKQLAGAVESAIAPLGYPTETRPFAAHLTLGRVRDDADRPTREALYSVVEPYLSYFRPEPLAEFPRFGVDRVSLMQSTLQRGGAVYRAIETFDLPREGQ